MGVDQVRARAASTRKLSNDGVKHTNVPIGLAAVEFTCDERCTQVSFSDALAAGATFYIRFDRNTANGGVDITTANGVPLVSGQPWDVAPGTVIQLISTMAAQELRALEALNA